MWFGCSLPGDFGDWQAEYHKLRESVAVVDKNYLAYLEFTGPDRVRYLNAILTNDIKGLLQDQGNVSLFLNPQGHIQAEIETQARADKMFCVSHAMIRERLLPELDKYIIMDDVTLTDRTEEYATLAVEGPKAPVVIAELTGIPLGDLEEWESRDVFVKGIACRIVRRTPGRDPSGEFLLPRNRAAELWEILGGAAKQHGGGTAGYQALNSVRLEQGIPWFSYDFDERRIPHEAGLQNSHISYTKGCYTGQEIVERVRSRGQVNRVRVSLQFETKEAPAASTPLVSEGKEVGSVTRAGFSPALNSFIGMGYLRRERSAEGMVVEAAGSKATVILTPVA